MVKWLPKNERKKILLLSDDLRLPSGIGVMSREIVEHTCGYYNWAQMGAALNHPEVGKGLDYSEQMAKQTGIKDPSVVIYPQNGYGNILILRVLIEREKPDAILHFTDPRQWVWLYQMEHEIRQHIPLIYYNIWDSTPAPKWNRDYYRSSDALFAISKQTYNINKHVLGEENVTLLKDIPAEVI